MTIETVCVDIEVPTESDLRVEKGVEFYMEHSKLKTNGVREVPKAAFNQRLKEEHGIDEAEYKRLQTALDFETTVAAHVALNTIESDLRKASAEDLASDDFRKGLSAIVRLPTPGGNTEVEVKAERHDNIPFREGSDGPSHKITYGRLSTKINTKSRIDKDFHETAASRIRAILGVAE